MVGRALLESVASAMWALTDNFQWYREVRNLSAPVEALVGSLQGDSALSVIRDAAYALAQINRADVPSGYKERIVQEIVEALDMFREGHEEQEAQA